LYVKLRKKKKEKGNIKQLFPGRKHSKNIILTHEHLNIQQSNFHKYHQGYFRHLKKHSLLRGMGMFCFEYSLIHDLWRHFDKENM